MYHVYILRNPAGRQYIGVTENVPLRLSQHNAGLSKWTSKYRPWELFWTSRTMTLGDARRLENAMKRQKGGGGLQTLMQDYGS